MTSWKDDKSLLSTLHEMDIEYQSFINNMNEKLKAPSTTSETKVVIMVVKAFEESIIYLEKQGIKDIFHFDDIEKIVQKMAEKTDVDLSSIKTQLDMLNKQINRPVFSHIDEYLKEHIELKKKRDKWLKDNR